MSDTGMRSTIELEMAVNDLRMVPNSCTVSQQATKARTAWRDIVLRERVHEKQRWAVDR
jgi:hypothetical protein